MAGSLKTITFLNRQPDIALARVVNLKFTEGDLRAEYVPASEVQGDGFWAYQFLVQEEDLPGGLTMDDVCNANIIEPYWAALEADLVDEEAEECQIRAVRCFDDVPVIETLDENDYVAIMRYNEECNTRCLVMMAPYTFLDEAAALEP